MIYVSSLISSSKRSSAGFTLVELLVVILILGILLAIALPAFLGAQDNAQDSAAKTKVNTIYKVAKTVAAQNEGSFVSTAAIQSAVTASEGYPTNSYTVTVPEGSTRNLEIRVDSSSDNAYCGMRIVNSQVTEFACPLS